MTDDSDDDDVELRRVSGPRFGTAGGHLDRDDDVTSTITSYTHVHIQIQYTVSRFQEVSQLGPYTMSRSAKNSNWVRLKVIKQCR